MRPSGFRPVAPSSVMPLLLISMMIFAVSAGCDRRDDAEADEVVRTVRVEEVSRGDLVETVSLVGELEGVEEVRVLALVSDRIRRLAVREGDLVEKGDLLVVVEGDLMSRAVEQAEAGLDAATASRDSLEREIERMRPLVAAGSAPRSQIEALEDQLRAVAAQVRQASAGLGQAAAQRGRAVIRSPISGVVSAVTAREGEIAAPSMPLLTIVSPDELKVVSRAPERHFLRVREGMKARVTPLADQRTSVEASVSLRGPVVDRMTRTGLLEILVDNSDGALTPGSAVRVVIEASRRRGVILVPAEAVVFTGETELTGRAAVFVADGEVARRREVVVGERQHERIEIVEGLGERELIVVRGAQFLRDGHAIRLDEPRHTGRDETLTSQVARPGASEGEGSGDRTTEEVSR